MLWRLIRSFAGGTSRAKLRADAETFDEALFSGSRDAWFARARALEKRGELDSAIDCYRQYVAAHPSDLLARIALANALSFAWRVEESYQAGLDALELSHGEPHVFSGSLLYSHFVPTVKAAAVFELHRRYGARMAELVPAAPALARDPDPDRHLRIGYVSRDFRRHSVADFIEPVIAHHDRSRFTVCCYHVDAETDNVTERFARAADEWHAVGNEDSENLTNRIRDDAIDILVDLSGHTKRNRLDVFARRAAPIQVTWLGYPDTTGLATMDYRITDAIADPPGAEARHTERLLRLEPPFVCYAPSPKSPSVRSAPRDDVVFGSFNMIVKVNRPLIALWSQVLAAVPRSRMLVKSAMLEQPDAAARIADEFARCGIGVERIELRPWLGRRADHLAAYHEVDIALDTYPYNGTTTTCEALWMGVPVVTLAGERHMSRVGATLLASVGLDSLVARDASEYVKIAIDLAGDTARRRGLALELRERLARSRLLDHAGFVRRLEHAYRTIWSSWCEEQTRRGEARERSTS